MTTSRAPETGHAPAPAVAADRRPALVALGVSLVACAIAVVIGGAALPVVLGLEDVGPVVRWGLPLVRVVQDGTAALTMGLLVVGALFVPGRKTPGVTLRASRYAVASGVVWVVATVVGVVLGFADAAGTPVDDPQFWSQFTEYVWTLETLRVAIISAVIAAAATTVAAVSLQRKGIAAAAFLAIAAVLPLALAGHAAGTADHETAVNTIAAHLVGASLWVGGLLAIVVLRPTLGRALPVVVERYSGLALWCFVAVGVSGVVSAVIRLGGLADLGNLFTAYGALILVKTTCLVVLGLMGWQQRRRVVGRMATAGPARGLFVRFAVTELVVMGVAVGFATALARTPTPASPGPLDTSASAQLTGYPQPAAPSAATWVTLWRFDWLWGVLALIAVGVYVMWVVRLRRRGDHWSVLRVVWWVVGWGILAWATNGAAGVLGRVSFSWHMIEHMTIAMYAPMFLVLAAPVSLALRALAVPDRRQPRSS